MNDIFFREENSDINDFTLDTRWIQEFESIDYNYKQFYNEVVCDK